MEYGYVRVSTKEQNGDRQMIALMDCGIEERNIYVDKQSGKDFNRENYKKMIRKMKPGDILFVKSIDRLGRNYHEILEQWRTLTEQKKIAIVVLDFPLLDTREKRDLTGTLLTDMILQILSYTAEIERNMIRQRQAEGIAAAQARGVHFGRKPIERPKEFEALKAAWKKKEISARKAAAQLGITHQTFLRWAKEKL